MTATRATALRIHANIDGNYTLLGEVALRDGALASTPALGKAQDLADFLAVLHTQGVGPGLSDEEFFDTLPARVNPYFGAVEQV